MKEKKEGRKGGSKQKNTKGKGNGNSGTKSFQKNIGVKFKL